MDRVQSSVLEDQCLASNNDLAKDNDIVSKNKSVHPVLSQ